MVGFKDLPQPSISEDFMLSIVDVYTYMSKLQNPKQYLHSGSLLNIPCAIDLGSFSHNLSLAVISDKFVKMDGTRIQTF